MLYYAKARNSASPDSRTQTGIYQSSVLLWHRDSLVVYVVLCQSLEFSFAGFQDTSRYFPKSGEALASGQPGFIRALCQSLEFSFDGFQGTSRHFPKPGVALAPGQPGFIRALCQSLEFSFAGFQDTSRYLPKPGIQLCRILGFGIRTALSYLLPYAQAWN